MTSKYCVQTRPVNCSTVQYSTVQNSTGQEAACLCAGCRDMSRATNDPALPDSPDRSDLAGGPLGWGGIKLSVRGLPFR